MEKPVLVIDCVTWSPHYDKNHPLWNVGGWFQKGWGAEGNGLDVCHIEDETLPALEDVSGLILTGSPASSYDDVAWIRKLEAIVLRAVDIDLPILGVCFGHQVVAQALGGKVEKNERGWELGDPEMTLTAQGAIDPLFEDMPTTFRAIQSHQDVVTKLPDGAAHLARSPLCEYQAFGVGEHIRCVQFHPEMGPEHLEFILKPRRDRILKSSGIDIEDVLPTVRQTPESRMVFGNFRRHFLFSKE